MAVIGAAMPLIVSDTLTRSSGMPAKAASMSARVSMAMPTRPTSPSARGSSESRPSCVGKSKATFSASWPWAIRYLKRPLVSSGVPKPMYWRMVHSRSRYMLRWIPRVYGYSPGWPISAAASRPARSSGPYTGFTGMPAWSFTSLMPPSVSRPILECRHDLGQRRTHRKHPRHAQRQQRLDVARRDDAADDHADPVGALGPQPLQHPRGQRQMRTGQDRQPDHVHVLLDGLGHDLLGGPLESGVHHLDTGVTQGVGDHLGAAVVAVEAGLGDQDFHGFFPAATSSVTS